MLNLKTALLWLAFLLLFLQYIFYLNAPNLLNIVFRLAPSALLLLWFLLSVFFKDNMRLDTLNTPSYILKLLKILRPAASISIILGAVFKLLHLQFSNSLLVLGIGLMAIYSTVLAKHVKLKANPPNDIVDDLDD